MTSMINTNVFFRFYWFSALSIHFFFHDQPKTRLSIHRQSQRPLAERWQPRDFNHHLHHVDVWFQFHHGPQTFQRESNVHERHSGTHLGWVKDGKQWYRSTCTKTGLLLKVVVLRPNFYWIFFFLIFCCGCWPLRSLRSLRYSRFIFAQCWNQVCCCVTKCMWHRPPPFATLQTSSSATRN